MLADWKSVGDVLRCLPPPEVSLQHQVRQQIWALEAGSPSVQSAPSVQSSSSPTANSVSLYSPADHSARRRLAVLTSCLAIAFLAFGIRTSLVNPVDQRFASGGLLSRAVDWQVVVLTLEGDAVEPTSRLMRDTVAELGLEVQPLVSRDSSDARHDVLLAGAEESEAVLRSLRAAETAGLAAELNPRTVGGLDRRQLLSRLEQSMKTPTRSDEFFGEMLVAVSVGDSVVVKTVPSSEDKAQPGTSSLAQSNGDVREVTVRTARGPASIADYLTRQQTRPVVFVIRRAEQQPDEPQGSRSTRNPPDLSALVPLPFTSA